jgi:hypothetical protein
MRAGGGSHKTRYMRQRSYSEIRYEAIVLHGNTLADRQTGVLAGVGCGIQLSGVARHNTKRSRKLRQNPERCDDGSEPMAPCALHYWLAPPCR